MSKAAWPWYSFLYRAFGPHGTFWLWCLALGAIYLNADIALITIINDRPQTRSVADVASEQFLWQTWVTLEGTELTDARQLLGRPGQSGPPLRLLMDPSDPAAEKWAAIAALAAQVGDPPDRTTPQGRAFERQRARFKQDREAYLPRRPIILIADSDEPEGVAPISSQASILEPPIARSGDPIEDYNRSFQAAVALIRQGVRPASRHEGLLDTTPPSFAGRAFSELELGVAQRMLRLDRRPRKLPLYIVGAAALVLLFLIVGLIGVSRAERAAPAPKPPPPTPASEPEGS